MGLARPNRRGATNDPPGPTNGAGASPTRGNGADHSGRIDFSRGHLSVTIPSDYLEGRTVQERIMDEVQKTGSFGPDSIFAIRIALEEALVNAIKHGNRLDPQKKVYVEARVVPGRTEIIIEDQGPGFDRRHVPDPCADENLLKCSGRGILLIEAYMKTKWSRGGRRVKMVKEAK